MNMLALAYFMICGLALNQIFIWRAIKELRQDNDLLSRRISTAHGRLAIVEQKQQWEELANAPIECVERVSNVSSDN